MKKFKITNQKDLKKSYTYEKYMSNVNKNKEIISDFKEVLKNSAVSNKFLKL